MRLALVAALLAFSGLDVAAAPAPVTPTPAAPALVPIRYRTYVAANQLGVPFDIGSLEIESAVAPGITVGGLGSYASFGDDRWATFDAKVRYYPAEIVLQRFSLGLSGGYTHYSTLIASGTVVNRRSLDYPTLGVLADYNWLLGQAGRFLVGTGVGAKRVIASRDDRAMVNLEYAYMTARFVVGLAF
jgi:hypothetical protein